MLTQGMKTKQQETLRIARKYITTRIYKSKILSQPRKRGQAGEGAAGDAGDGIGCETSAMERIKE